MHCTGSTTTPRNSLVRPRFNSSSSALASAALSGDTGACGTLSTWVAPASSGVRDRGGGSANDTEHVAASKELLRLSRLEVRSGEYPPGVLANEDSEGGAEGWLTPRGPASWSLVSAAAPAPAPAPAAPAPVGRGTGFLGLPEDAEEEDADLEWEVLSRLCRVLWRGHRHGGGHVCRRGKHMKKESIDFVRMEAAGFTHDGFYIQPRYALTDTLNVSLGWFVPGDVSFGPLAAMPGVFHTIRSADEKWQFNWNVVGQVPFSAPGDAEFFAPFMLQRQISEVFAGYVELDAYGPVADITAASLDFFVGVQADINDDNTINMCAMLPLAPDFAPGSVAFGVWFSRGFMIKPLPR